MRRWVLTFGPAIPRGLRAQRPKPYGRWHLDDMFVRIGSRQMYLWRAVDAEGEVLDVLVQPRRDKTAARKLMRKRRRQATALTWSVGWEAEGRRSSGTAVRVAGDDAGNDVGQVGIWVDAEELASFHEGRDHGPVLGAAVGAGEQSVLTGESERPDGALDGVGVDLDAAVIEEEAQARPAYEGALERVGQLALLADEGEALAKPGLEGVMMGRLRAWQIVRRSSGERPRISTSIR